MIWLYILIVSSWMNHFFSLMFSFLICKREIIPHRNFEKCEFWWSCMLEHVKCYNFICKQDTNAFLSCSLLWNLHFFEVDLQNFMADLLTFLKPHLQPSLHPHNPCEWISRVFIEQDDDMLEAARASLGIYLKLIGLVYFKVIVVTTCQESRKHF